MANRWQWAGSLRVIGVALSGVWLGFAACDHYEIAWDDGRGGFGLSVGAEDLHDGLEPSDVGMLLRLRDAGRAEAYAVELAALGRAQAFDDTPFRWGTAAEAERALRRIRARAGKILLTAAVPQ